MKSNKTNLGLRELIINNLKGQTLQYKGRYKNKAWINQLIQEQSNIGNEQMRLGHITQTWGDIQEHKYWQAGQKAAYTGTRWARIILQQIFQHVLYQWDQRNKKLHQHLQQPAPYQEAVQQDIRRLYWKFEKTPDVFPRLYKHKLEQLLLKAMRYLLQGHALMRPLEQYVKVQAKRRSRQDVRKFLHMHEKPPEQTREPSQRT